MRQRYQCKDCQLRFDDLSQTIFAGDRQPLGVWMLCLYLLGLNLSNQQIAAELDLNQADVQRLTEQLREGIVQRQPQVILAGEVEGDEADVIAGHKGQPDAVKKKGRIGRRRRLKAKAGRGTLAKEKPPIFGMIQSGGEVVLRMLSNVKPATIAPVIQDTIVPRTLIDTDEYRIDARLVSWGYEHKSLCHARGEYARDEVGDGFCEVHVNTMEGFWSLLRSWLRPHRGSSQAKLPLELSFFEFVHHARKRGNALLSALLECLLC
jgi:transposase-like protein